MKQKQIFIKGEADAWFDRNHKTSPNEKSIHNDPVINEILKLNSNGIFKDEVRLLEVGCGEGRRLEWICNNLSKQVYGLDPSEKALKTAKKKGVKVKKGTADKLPFDENMFDIIIFGFCLYVCDRDDLINIVAEADRVLKNDSWLIIHDFYSEDHVKKKYHHKDGVHTYKMDYRKLFDWHPNYTCYSHQIFNHEDNTLTDNANDWISVSVLRKKYSNDC
jgi:ubiquinone/menaquinone biosynthesis C-methylase UbiE